MKHLCGFVAAVISGPVLAGVCGHAYDFAVPPSEAGLRLCVETDRFSDPLSLQQLIRNELSQSVPRGQKNLIYARDEARMSVKSGGGYWSLLVRQSATLSANAGAVDVIRDVSTSGSSGASYQHDVRLRFKGFAGFGVAFDSAAIQLAEGISFRGGVQGLSVSRLITRDLNGFASYDALTRAYGLHAVSEYANDRLHFPYQSSYGKQGLGVLLNTRFAWQIDPSTTVGLNVEDVGLIRWQRMPQETLGISTETSQVDADGYLVYRPLAQGRNHQDGFTASTVSTVSAEIKRTVVSGITVDVRMNRINGFAQWLPYLGMERQVNDLLYFKSGWLFHERALQFSMGYGAWRLSLAGDRIDGRAHARNALIGWQTSLK